MTGRAMPVDRGCGRRVAGGVYLETGFSPYGRPLEHFLIDPPILITDEMMQDLGISPQGVSLFQDPSTEVWHIINWIGATHYQHFGDFYYEGKRFGFSTRAPITTRFELLSRQSEIVHIHPNGHLRNWHDYVLSHMSNTQRACPRAYTEHLSDTSSDGEMCIDLLDHAVDAGTPYGEQHPDTPETAYHARHVERQCPAFTWGTRYYDEYEDITRPEYPPHDVYCSPEGVDPEWAPAMVLRLPISRLTLIEGADDHKQKLQELEARASGLPVAVESE